MNDIWAYFFSFFGCIVLPFASLYMVYLHETYFPKYVLNVIYNNNIIIIHGHTPDNFILMYSNSNFAISSTSIFCILSLRLPDNIMPSTFHIYPITITDTTLIFFLSSVPIGT